MKKTHSVNNLGYAAAGLLGCILAINGQMIQNAMATLMQGRTSFVIAHRLSTIKDSNIILYMENGDIKEVGDHETLLAMNGKYAELYNSQFA